MDPNQALRDALEAARAIIAARDTYGGNGAEPSLEDVETLAERVLALDEWITGGGFLPEAWASS